MKKTIKYPLLFIKYLPLYLIYRVASADRVLVCDMKEWIRVELYSDIYSIRNILEIFRRPEYRTVLYKRKPFISVILGWIYRPQILSILCTKSEDIGEGFVLQHGFSSVVNAKKIGNNCQIWQNVTIGVQHSGMMDKPTIGDNCKICTGAIVVGNITIGNNVTIGAGTVVTKDIPANSVVYGAQNRISSI